MPTKGYFMQMTGAVLLGLAALVVAAILVFALAPYILPFFAAMLPFLVGAFLVIIAVIVIWVILYVAAIIGVAIYYAIKHPISQIKTHHPNVLILLHLIVQFICEIITSMVILIQKKVPV